MFGSDRLWTWDPTIVVAIGCDAATVVLLQPRVVIPDDIFVVESRKHVYFSNNPSHFDRSVAESNLLDSIDTCIQSIFNLKNQK